MILRQLTCPYCYATFTAWRIEFRCTGRPGPDGRSCDRVPDERVLRHTGNGAALPPAFKRPRHGLATGHRVRHGTCGTETSYRICPECHAQLPVRFGTVENRMIAMVGARDAGKTVFMTVLLHEMRHRIGQAFNAAVAGADDQTRNRFRDEYESVLYHDHRLPQATPGATRTFGRVPPLVFEFAVQRRTRFGTRTVLTLLSFFDTAGEDLTSQESVDYHARYLRNADGIIVLLDPLQMPEAKKLAQPGVKLPEAADQEQVLERVTTLLHRASRKPIAKISKPVAVAFPKIDTIEHALTVGSPLLRDSDYPPGRSVAYDTYDADEVHLEVQQLLHSWESGHIDRYLGQNYRTYRYFGLTALGEEPTTGGEMRYERRISDRHVRPRRVADPLLWLLSEFGAIAATRPAAEGR